VKELAMLRRILLGCGIAASLLYVATDVAAAIWYPDYHSFTSRVISELMASGAPTERLVDPLFLLYGVLMLGFGVGMWMSDDRKRMHVAAALLLVYTAIGFLGPTLFEMNVRGSGGPAAADQRHIALTALLVLVMMAGLLVAAPLRGRRFRIYTYASVAAMIVLGGLTGVVAARAGDGPTPWAGVLERGSIGAFLLWIAVLAVLLLQREVRVTDRLASPH
jgi:hypothetical protein